jgi:hypothetical protein
MFWLACAVQSTLETGSPPENTPTPAFHALSAPCLPGQEIALNLETDAPYGLSIELVYTFGPILPISMFEREEMTVYFSCGELGENSPELGPVRGYQARWITAP